MRGRPFWSPSLGQWLLAASLAASAGCLSFVHPAGCPEQAVREECTTLPKCCRDHVYVFFLNGFDPLSCGNLKGVRHYLYEMGFTKTYYGQLYHLLWFKHEICRIRAEDPDARFALVGFNLGVNGVNALARHVEKQGVPIDLMVFLSGNKGIGVSRTKPGNVARVVNILPEGKNATRGERDYADNSRLCGTGHFGAPTHVATLRRLAEELATLCAAVPAKEPVMPSLPPSPEDAPTPRPVKALRPSPPDAWDFLAPVSHLGKRPE
jgi:hypothetical protein